MEICSIPSMVYITGVRACNRQSFSKIGIHSRQYAKVRATVPCLVHNRAFYGQKRQICFSLGPFIEFKLRTFGI